MAIRVVQWTSGGVAREVVRAIVSDTRMELVGMFAFSEEKVGQDAGELCGLDPLGLAATDEIEKLIRLAPDVVSYNPLYPDVDHLVRLLEAGIDVVTTCNFLTGWGLDYNSDRYGPNARRRLQEAALRGGASMFGTGINPGHVNYQACVMSALCEKVDHLLISEVVHDIAPFLGDPNIAEFGYGAIGFADRCIRVRTRGGIGVGNRDPTDGCSTNDRRSVVARGECARLNLVSIGLWSFRTNDFVLRCLSP